MSATQTLPELVQLETQRLVLRRWQQSDREPFAAMSADIAVMHFYAAPMTRKESDESVDRYVAGFEKNGFSFMVATLKETNEFAGIIGAQIMRDIVPNLPQPAVEIGWRLTQSAQGQGLATEGAQAVIQWAFEERELNEIVAVTVPSNPASRRVMEKLGMTHRPEFDFDHPRVPAGHNYLRHTLYSLSNPKSSEVPCSIPS